MEFMVAKLRELVHSKCETYFDAFLLFLTHPNSLLVLRFKNAKLIRKFEQQRCFESA